MGKINKLFGSLTIIALIAFTSFACGGGSGGSSSGSGGYSEDSVITCEVSFNTLCDSPPPDSIILTYKGAYGDLGGLPEVGRDGYKFIGWTINDNGTGETIKADTVVDNPKDHTLYAKWDIVSDDGGGGSKYITVTFDSQGGNPNPPSITVVLGGTYGVLPVVSLDGHSFEGWTINGTGEIIKADTVVENPKDHTLYAKWRASSGGVYFVTTTIPDYGWGPPQQDSRFFIDNTFKWLWPKKAKKGKILLVIEEESNMNPWSNTWYNSWRTAMRQYGIDDIWEERTGESLSAEDLKPTLYQMVIIAEGMDDSYMPNMNKLVPALEEYVRNGGVLLDMIGTNNMYRWSGAVAGPFGTRTMAMLDDCNYVAAKGHPMVYRMTKPYFTGSYASHGRIKKIPKGSTVLLRAGTKLCGMPVACWLEF